MQGIHHREQIIGHMPDTVDDFAGRTFAAATMVMGNHPEMLGELLYLLGPEYPAAAKSGAQ